MMFMGSSYGNNVSLILWFHQLWLNRPENCLLDAKMGGSIDVLNFINEQRRQDAELCRKMRRQARALIRQMIFDGC